MRKVYSAITTVLFLMIIAILPQSTFTAEPLVYLMVIEHWRERYVTVNQIPPEDNSMTNHDYKLPPF